MNYYIKVSEAKNIIKAHIFKTKTIELPLLEAHGYYTAEAITAPLDVPSFDNSAMDGYGFRFDDLTGVTKLKVTHDVAAGAAVDYPVLGKGEAVRIFTGAKIPEGVDTVVMKEKTRFDSEYIRFDFKEIKKGENIRLKASQTSLGECMIEAHTFINHGVIGFLAGFGIEKIKVYDKVKVGLLFTGNELVELGETLSEGEIYNSNAYTLQAALLEINHHLTWLHHVQDTPEATFSAIKNAFDKVDVLLITGGISVGGYDYVKSALEKLSVTELFYKIKQKPGKPLFFGKLREKYVFALPGNPASVFSCYHQYVKPFLLGCAGREYFYEERDEVINEARATKKRAEITQFLKAYYNNGKVRILNDQESYKMNSVVLANCLLEFPEGKTEIEPGESVSIWRV